MVPSSFITLGLHFFLLVWELCTCRGVQTTARGSLYGVRSLLSSLSGFEESYSRCQAFPASIFTCREVMELSPGEFSFPVLIGLENAGFPCRRALCPHHLSLPCVLYGVCGHHARRAGFLPVLPRGATSLFKQLAIYTFTDCPQLCS